MKYLLIFIITGLIGWSIDTMYRSVKKKCFSAGTWVPFFSLSYGAAGVMLYVVFFYWPTSFFVHVIAGTALSILWELTAGIMTLHFLRRRLWDYRKSWLNFRGHIDAAHSFYWFVLTAFYRIIFELF